MGDTSASFFVKDYSVCRICLNNEEITTNLFSADETSKVILDKIYSCFQIVLSYQKNLPTVICRNCIEELEIASNFRVKCLTFEERIQIYYKLKENKQLKEVARLQIRKLNDTANDNTLETTNHNNINLESGSITYKKNVKANDTVSSCIDNSKETFICDTCNKVMKTKSSLSKHISSIHERRKHLGRRTGSGDNRRYHCTSCPYSTPHSQTMVNHIRRHDGSRPYHCQCGKSFTQSAGLRTHEKTHSSNTFYTCSTCGMQFKHKFTWKRHLLVHETSKLACDICHSKLKTTKSLNEHMQRHNNVRNYSCEECGATFVTNSELTNHRKTHDTVKRVVCHLCDYKTYTRKNLILHLKRHAGEKMYKCDLCTMSMYTNSDLQRHRRVHSHEKPFPCPICTQRFAHSTSLNKHMRTVHGIQYKWSDCKESASFKLQIKQD